MNISKAIIKNRGRALSIVINLPSPQSNIKIFGIQFCYDISDANLSII